MIYKIRSKSTGLFIQKRQSYSGWYWGKTGSVWKNRSAVTNAIRHGTLANNPKSTTGEKWDPLDLEIVGFELQEMSRTPFNSW